MKKKIRKGKRVFSTKYRSGFEQDLHEDLGKCQGIVVKYEEDVIPYTIPATQNKYHPDFTILTKGGKTIYIEAKGLWIYADRYKHLLLKQQHPELDIRFVFYNQKNKLSKASKTTYQDICEGRGRGQFKGLTWKYSNKKIPKDWLAE